MPTSLKRRAAKKTDRTTLPLPAQGEVRCRRNLASTIAAFYENPPRKEACE